MAAHTITVTVECANELESLKQPFQLEPPTIEVHLKDGTVLYGKVYMIKTEQHDVTTWSCPVHWIGG